MAREALRPQAEVLAAADDPPECESSHLFLESRDAHLF